jgi:hypothetical protein
MRSFCKISGLKCAALLLLVVWGARQANASASLLLEEPYGRLGAFTGTGHAAIYLSRVCAATALVLRRCSDGETGVVISRYNGIAGYDWVAVPLIPYLYAVENPREVPLFADPKLVAFLRNQYRRKHLESIAPDLSNGEPPEGNWTQLVGSAYDRTSYGYEIETSEQQDDELIRRFNAGPNHAEYRALTRNCADFVREVINFYYPKAVHRNFIADAGITTPKQISKSLVKYGARHPQLELSTFVIPQVPGSVPRSRPVKGVIESLLKTKKYLVPLAVLHPIVTAGLAVAYVGDGRFDPARNAMVLNAGRDLQPPLPSTERHAYQSQLDSLFMHVDPHVKIARNEKLWERLQAEGQPKLDEEGRPVLQLRVGEDVVDLGISRDNILNDKSPPLLAEQLMAARLSEELKRSAVPKASQADVMSDWKLLEQLVPVESKLN